MDYIDYMEKLGLGFCDDEKQKQFMNRIRVYLHARSDIPFDRNQENAFAYDIGEPSKIEEELMKSDFTMNFGSGPEGLQRVWLYLVDKQNYFKHFLSALTVFANTYQGTQKNKKSIITAIKDAFRDSHIEYELYKDDDGIFFFPKGANELDDALVSEPLEWLKDYPKTRETFIRALKQYSNGEYVRDVADNFRKALEGFFKEFLENEADFDENRKEICKYLKSKGADNNITNMLEPLLAYYKKLNDDKIKHNDKLNPKLLEFIMYQTGLFIRMIITVGKEENNEEEK